MPSTVSSQYRLLLSLWLCFAAKINENKNKQKLRAYVFRFDEIDECRPFDLDWLSSVVVQRQHEMKEVRLPQVTRRLLLKMCPAQRYAAQT